MSRLLHLFIIIILFAAPAAAQMVGLFSSPEGLDPQLPCQAIGLVNVYVVVLWGPPTLAVQFRAPQPDCWVGATYLCEAPTAPFVSYGDSQNGICIFFGECLSGPIHVLTISYFNQVPPPPNSCCVYDILPYSGDIPGEVEFLDCSGSIIRGRTGCAYIGDGNKPASVFNPSPLDSAENVAINTQFSWDAWGCYCAGRARYSVRLGTSSRPPLVAWDLETKSYDPGPLQPNTTYFWRVHAYWGDPTPSVVSPLWRFTTGTQVPTARTTWGAIKSLYR